MRIEIYKKLSEHIIKSIEILKQKHDEYCRLYYTNYDNGIYIKMIVIRSEAQVYIKGLCDAGLIHKNEGKILYTYVTI